MKYHGPAPAGGIFDRRIGRGVAAPPDTEPVVCAARASAVLVQGRLDVAVGRGLREAGNRSQAMKGLGWMPRLREAMKDVASCDKLRLGANSL